MMGQWATLGGMVGSGIQIGSAVHASDSAKGMNFDF
jgi:hypothetical protein